MTRSNRVGIRDAPAQSKPAQRSSAEESTQAELKQHSLRYRQGYSRYFLHNPIERDVRSRPWPLFARFHYIFDRKDVPLDAGITLGHGANWMGRATDHALSSGCAKGTDFAASTPAVDWTARALAEVLAGNWRRCVHNPPLEWMENAAVTA